MGPPRVLTWGNLREGAMFVPTAVVSSTRLRGSMEVGVKREGFFYIAGWT